jgi:hypothetical protein
MEEKNIKVIAGLIQDGIASPTYWIAVFSDKQAIFLKISKNTAVELASPLANRIASAHESETIAASFRLMTIDQILASQYEKVVFSSDEMNNFEIKETSDLFFRCMIKFPYLGKKIKITTNRQNIRIIKDSLHIINPQLFSGTKPLHSEGYQENMSYLIKALGLILFFYNLVGLFNKVGIMDILLVIAGIFIFFKQKIGAYILAIVIIIDLLLMKIFAAQIEINSLIKNIITLILLGIILLFLWKNRSQLK